jgi:DNA sulfur modification protein DndE
MPVENIKLSQKAKESLSRLKRGTGIQHWNVLCRWAFCTSLKEESVPPQMNHPADSNVEMTWKIFAGEYGELYWAILKERLRRDGIELTEENLHVQFRLHLHRGISYLASSDFFAVAPTLPRT